MNNWLLAEFTFLGLHFQNWMPMVAGIVTLLLLYWRKRGFL